MTRKMKDSGIEWIGEIPEDWKLSKIKYVTKCFDGRRIPVDTSLRIDGIYPYWGAGSIQGYVNDYIFDEEIVLLGEDGAPFFDKTRDVAFLINEKVWVNNHIHVLKGTLIKNEYLVYFLNIVDYTDYINGSILNKLTQGNMKSISIVYPPTRDQINIIELLREKTSKIEEMKIKINKQIQTLEDYKKSLITEAVTKGLDKNVEMKDSGIEWIGEIPKHWEIKRLKQILSNNSLRVGPFGSALKSSDIVDSGKWIYNQRTVLDNNFETNDTFIDDSKFNELISFKVNAGDILLTTRGTIGRIAIVPKSFYEGVIHPCIIKFRVKEGIFKNALIKYIFNSTDIVLKQVEYLSNSTTIGVIYSYNLVNIYFPTPPINEQLEIINYLDKKTATIDEAIAAKKKQLETLEEYKKSLIYEYVTGKKEVEDVGTI